MAVDEIVVISGKGGTGKTTLTASIIPFLKKTVIADCDVDAPDLHILLQPRLTDSEDFIGLKKASISAADCTACGLCAEHCRFNAIGPDFVVNHIKCEGCGVCEYLCPSGAVQLNDVVVGSIYEGDSLFGPMIHAKLIPGEETSGKLVSAVRNRARVVAEKKGFKRVLIDGSPGIGCNVISSITGAKTVIVVTEPTMSGLHDLKRVLDICERFSGQTFIAINKFDLSNELSRQIEQEANRRGHQVILKFPFHKNIVKAVTEKKIPSLVESKIFEKARWNDFMKSILEGEIE